MNILILALLNVAGPVGGMEYPGIVFDWWQMSNKVLWYVTAHELGHILGSR